MKSLSKEQIEKFEKLLKEIFEDNKVKGIAIKAFYKTGEIIYEDYFGYKNEEKKL